MEFGLARERTSAYRAPTGCPAWLAPGVPFISCFPNVRNEKTALPCMEPQFTENELQISLCPSRELSPSVFQKHHLPRHTCSRPSPFTPICFITPKTHATTTLPDKSLHLKHFFLSLYFILLFEQLPKYRFKLGIGLAAVYI